MNCVCFIWLSLFSIFSGSFTQHETDKLYMGLYYMLTNPEIVEDYGLENIIAHTSCSKVVIFMISDSLSSATAEQFNQSKSCVLGLEKKEIFFEGYDAYFKIVSFRELKKKQMLKLQLITPNYQPKGESELFLLVEYRMSNCKLPLLSYIQN